MAFQLKSSKFIPHCFVWRGGLGWGSPGDGRDEEGGAWQGGVSWRFCTLGGGKNGDGEFWWGSFGGLVKVFGIGPVMVIAFIHMDGGPTPPTQSWGSVLCQLIRNTLLLTKSVSNFTPNNIVKAKPQRKQKERPHCKEIETLWHNCKYTIHFFQPSWVGTRIPCRPTRWRHRCERLVETTTRQVDIIFFISSDSFYQSSKNIFQLMPC